MVWVGKMHRDSKLLALFPWYPCWCITYMSLVCVDTIVCRTACSSTSVWIQMGNILHLLVSTTTLTVYTNLSSFTVDWYVDLPCYTWVLAPHHTCMFCNLHSLTFKIHVICVVHFQDNQEFNPTASCLCEFISGTFHLNFILQNSWHHCCKVWKEVTWHLVMTTTSFHDPTNSWPMILFSLQGPERSDKH